MQGEQCKGKRSSFATSEHKNPDDDIENWRHQILEGGAKHARDSPEPGLRKQGHGSWEKDCGVQYAQKLVLVQ